MKLLLNNEQKIKKMELFKRKLIVVFGVLFISLNSYSQLLEPIRAAQDMAGDVEVAVALNKKYANEMERKVNADLKEKKRALEKMVKEGDDYRDFMKNAKAVKSILSALNALTCMLDEYSSLLKSNKRFGYTCYQEMKYRLYSQQIGALVTSLNSLFNETEKHVESIDRNKKLLTETERTVKLTNSLNEDIKYEKGKSIIFGKLQKSKDKQVEEFSNSYFADVRGYQNAVANKNK